MSRPVFRFLEFELITARRELTRDGEPLAVEPKVYDLLLFLLQHRDRAVDKHELQDEIWPNVIVTESALTRCVMKARQLVGDDSKDPRVIRTVRGGGYSFVADVEEVSPSDSQSRSRARSRDRVAIAVLPFDNLSAAASDAILADGLTLDISTDLSRNAWMLVISHRTMKSYQSSSVGYAQLADELGVSYVVEGSVRRDGDRLRVTAALVDAYTGVSEWTERYDRRIEDLFDIQEQIANHIASALGSHVRRAEARRAERADPESLDVWGLLHRGMAISWSKFNRESNLEAEQLYRQALQLEPENPRAKVFLAMSVAMKVSNGWSENLVADQYEAWNLGKAAIGMSPDDPVVLASYGHLNTCLGKSGDAVEVLQRAVELDPSSAWAMGLLAFALTGDGRGEDAIDSVTQALRYSPRDLAAHWLLAMLSWAYIQTGHYDDAAREAQRSINAYAGWSVTWGTLAVARSRLGQLEEAKDALNTCAELDELATPDGYAKYFRFVCRDGEDSEQISDWLHANWPRAGQLTD